MTGFRVLSVVILGSLHWAHAVGQGVVADFVLVDSGSDSGWLRPPESVAAGPNGGPGSWLELQPGGEAKLWSWSFGDELLLEAHERGFVHVDLLGVGPQVNLDRIVLVDQDYRGNPLDLDIAPSYRESENTNRAPPVLEGELKLWHPVTIAFDGSSPCGRGDVDCGSRRSDSVASFGKLPGSIQWTNHHKRPAAEVRA